MPDLRVTAGGDQLLRYIITRLKRASKNLKKRKENVNEIRKTTVSTRRCFLTAV